MDNIYIAMNGISVYSDSGGGMAAPWGKDEGTSSEQSWKWNGKAYLNLNNLFEEAMEKYPLVV